MRFTKKQYEKLADQFRILSWAQGAILTSATGFKLPLTIDVVGIIITLWIFFQAISLILDKRSEK